ncbi:hypothetical protein Dsin_031362 [Dipteronia sinensis]|uniref:Leucine-rich repeat-containing N-terminal plant-type domain-containing protein n=1 Tax=Dipteronia sinensis TaxID=43782 RepID=A0AAD9ZL88_9ROSI|nr:hypothetical protein Dsin_031362 [Dipteronia sinensis]
MNEIMSLQLIITFLFILFSPNIKAASVVTSEVADVKIECIERERHALLIFKQGLIDADGLLSSWGGEDCCKWRGVSCSNTTGHVVKLNLNYVNRPPLEISYQPLRGNISSSLLELQHLDYLDLSFNPFGGQIPEFIGSLYKLQHLDLSMCWFSGRVPYGLGNLSRLQYLDLNGNFGSYVGKLEWLSNLSFLRHVGLNNINLTEATDWLQVVSELPSLTKLQLQACFLPSVSSTSISFVNSSKSLAFVDLSGNTLTNSIYLWLSNFSTSLVHVDLSLNNLQGPVPGFAFENMTSLLHLYLDQTHIEGIPNTFRNMCSLKRLSFLNSNLSGQLVELFLNLSGCTKDALEYLNLENNNLSGSLPDFTVLSSLRELHLFNNMLDGSFPKRFGQLSNLTVLDLGSNQLGGSLPDFSVFSTLKILRISNNKLNGTFSTSIGQLSKLEELYVSSNFLEDTISEVHMSNLFDLKIFDLSYNKLTLNFSSVWLPPFQLDVIALSNCKIVSRLPAWLQTQNKFSYLDLSSTEISGLVPSWFWDLSPNLYFLNLSNNSLRGVLPDLSLKFAGNPAIDLSFNYFEGSIPPFPPTMSSLSLSNNMFSGSISFLCANTGFLSYLDLSDNHLLGEFPSCWTPWETLFFLNLANNKFSGKIPNSMTSGCLIKSLHLRNNSMSGEMPTSLRNCERLAVIDLGNNKFSGTLPAWIGDSLLDLTILSLRSNRFHGMVPWQLCNLAMLQVLDFSRNSISGTIPECLNNLTAMVQNTSSNALISSSYILGSPGVNGGISAGNYQEHALLVWKGVESEYKSTLGLLKSIDLSSNKLSGEVPVTVTSLIGLISLNLSRNSLTGPIPPKIGQLNLLNTLDLSDNLLAGEIPESCSQLNALGVLDLSNNNLSGKIPSNTKLQSFDPSAYAGNLELCGPPLSNTCPGEEQPQDPDFDMEPREDGIITLGFYVSMALGFIAGFWGVVATLVLNRSWRHAYFQFLNHTKDQLYVAVVLNIAKFQRWLRS